jgi:DNA invertase Pin-like site-specific DNA recombinase
MANGQTIGYVRVSTEEQNPDRQIVSLNTGEIDKMFIDYTSGKTTARPELQKALSYVREGDTLIVWSIDRLSRSLRDLLELVDNLNERGVTLKFVKENMTFSKEKTDAVSSLILGVLGSVAEFERALIRERQMEGIAIAKAKGNVYKGRKPTLCNVEIQSLLEMVENGTPKGKVAKKFGVSRQTVYSYLEKSKV